MPIRETLGGVRRLRPSRIVRGLLPVVLAMGLVTGTFAAAFGAVPHLGSTVTGVIFSGTSQAENTSTSWTVYFSTSPAGQLSAGGSITIDFAPGFSIASPTTVVLGSEFLDCTDTSVVTGSQIVITLVNVAGQTCDIPGSTPTDVILQGVTNPGAGTYPASDFTVATSSDTAPAANIDAVTITSASGGVSNVTFTGTSMAANVTTSWTIGFTTGPSGNLSSSSQIVVTFAPGFSIPSALPTEAISGLGGCSTGTADGIGQTVTITLGGGGCVVGNSSPVVLLIDGITNPGAGSYANTLFSVYTSSDVNPDSPASNVVIGGTGSVLTTAASSVTAGGATLNGTDNPGGALQTCNFAYSTSSTLAGAIIVAAPSPGSGSSPVAETLAVTGLSASTTYYFQLECTNGNGGILSFFTSGTPLPQQIYGIDPIGTSIAISQAEFPANGSASAVVLARDDYFSDALAGGPLAAAVGGPMLLTEGAPVSSSLDPRTQAEIQRVLPAGGTVYILGGTLAISATVDSTLTSLGYHVVREAGADQFATAVDIAEQMGNPSTIFEATGTSYYDALSAVPAAIHAHAAILLTNGNVQAPETASYLSAHPGDTRYAIGGPLAAAGADPTATAVYGNDLYATSAAVAQTFFPGASIFGAATSATFTDALGGGVYMATGGRSGPLLIVNPSAPLPSEILPYLASLPSGAQGYVFGGPLAVGPDVLTALQQAVG